MSRSETKPYSRRDVLSTLSGNGKCRALHFLDSSIESQAKELNALCSEICKREQRSFFSIVDAKKVRTAKDWCSQFARNLRTGNGAKPMDLAKFALGVGKSLVHFKTHEDETGSKEETLEKIANSLTLHFSELVKETPKLLLCIRGLDELSVQAKDWLSVDFNHAIRKVPAFKNTRFLFSSGSENTNQSSFFDRFGFEKVRSFRMNDAENVPTKQRLVTDSRNDDTPYDIELNQAIEPKGLINQKKSRKLKSTSILKVAELNKDVKIYMSSYTEDEQRYLALASYPCRASRYSLEHFTDSRNAALCYNWLKRKPELFSLHPSGDLILKDVPRSHARAYHLASDPETSAKWAEVGSVLDLFFERFPFAEDHSFAVNLQAFGSFNQKLLNQLFSNDELSEIERFIARNEEQLIVDGKQFVLSDDAKLVTRRYMEISGREPLTGLLDRVREIWLEDQQHYSVKKAKLDEEKLNVTEEIEDTLQQIVKLNELKDKLLEDFKNPKRRKSEKSYSFTSSKALIFLGLATCGASVMFETLGTYHAACGLAVTLFGFFWPNVEVKRVTAGGEGPQSNLAIETQQRSLKHRIAGLGNRTGVMKLNLDDLDKQIANLGDSPPPSYLELSEDS